MEDAPPIPVRILSCQLGHSVTVRSLGLAPTLVHLLKMEESVFLLNYVVPGVLEYSVLRADRSARESTSAADRLVLVCRQIPVCSTVEVLAEQQCIRSLRRNKIRMRISTPLEVFAAVSAVAAPQDSLAAVALRGARAQLIHGVVQVTPYD